MAFYWDWSQIFDAVSNLANFVGLGDIADTLFSWNGEKSEKVVNQLVSQISNKLTKARGLSQNVINQIQARLTNIMSKAPSVAFKSRIGAISERLNNDMSKVQSLASDIETVAQNQINKVNELNGKSRAYIRSHKKEVEKAVQALDQPNLTNDLDKLNTKYGGSNG